MKFKAFLTDHGVNLLEKRFLPALDKMGKICHLYLTRDHAIFLHNLLYGDGIQSIAQFCKEALFEDYRISSHNDDCIAFTIYLSLLHRALHSIVNICTEFGGSHSSDAVGPTLNRLQIKLVKKLPPHSQQPMPFLTFETKGYKSAVIQDVPISKPLSRSDVLELQAALDMAQDLPDSSSSSRYVSVTKLCGPYETCWQCARCFHKQIWGPTFANFDFLDHTWSGVPKTVGHRSASTGSVRR